MQTTFESQLRDALESFDIDLPHELWVLIAWLEENEQRFETPAGLPFLAVMPAQTRADLWSHLAFEVPPDLVRFWLGDAGYEKALIPFLRCGGDGSYIALWRHAGAPDRFVFLGSEGEAFVIAERVVDLITILTMGYSGIEARNDLKLAPDHHWGEHFDGDWPEPVELHNWVRQQFGIVYPDTAARILPYEIDDDPFSAFVEDVRQ